MSNEQNPDQELTTDTGAADEETATAGGRSDELPGDDPKDAQAAEESSPEEQMEAAMAEISELKDRALRAAAEAENVRRRAARDVENAHRYALEKFTAALLPVVDSLEKAVESAETAENAAAVAEGVQLSLKLFIDTLEKSGISQVDPLGEPFNPESHEAIAMVENPDAEPHSVMDVMQKGYLLNGRLVRAAKVIVAKEPAN